MIRFVESIMEAKPTTSSSEALPSPPSHPHKAAHKGKGKGKGKEKEKAKEQFRYFNIYFISFFSSNSHLLHFPISHFSPLHLTFLSSSSHISPLFISHFSPLCSSHPKLTN
jgi:hypothetical protein